jgi:hypothetical protein
MPTSLHRRHLPALAGGDATRRDRADERRDRPCGARAGSGHAMRDLAAEPPRLAPEGGTTAEAFDALIREDIARRAEVARIGHDRRITTPGKGRRHA